MGAQSAVYFLNSLYLNAVRHMLRHVVYRSAHPDPCIEVAHCQEQQLAITIYK